MKKASDLTDDELSRVIAESFEPPSHFVNTCRDSEHGWWRRRYLNGWIVEPRSFSEPEIVVRLLKWLLTQPDWQCVIGDEWPRPLIEIEMTPTEDGWKSGKRGFCLQSSNIERVIAEAVAIAKGAAE